jgi:hypothetical protein
MEEETKTRLFGVTITAARTKEDGTPEIGIQNVVMFAIGPTDILGASHEHARRIYPEAEGWRDHKTVWTEIEKGMMFGPYRLDWDAYDTRLGAEQ